MTSSRQYPELRAVGSGSDVQPGELPAWVDASWFERTVKSMPSVVTLVVSAPVYPEDPDLGVDESIAFCRISRWSGSFPDAVSVSKLDSWPPTTSEHPLSVPFGKYVLQLQSSLVPGAEVNDADQAYLAVDDIALGDQTSSLVATATLVSPRVNATSDAVPVLLKYLMGQLSEVTR